MDHPLYLHPIPKADLDDSPREERQDPVISYRGMSSPSMLYICTSRTKPQQNEIFVYDRRYVSEPGNIDLPELPAPQPFSPDNPPDTLTSQNDLQAWRNLYMARRSWALGLAERCGSIDRSVRAHNERTDIINRAASVALENLKSHVGTLEYRFQEAQAWTRDLLKEQQAALEGWQRALATLGSIPARKEFSFLGRPSTPKKDQNGSTRTLRDFVDVGEVQRAGSDASVVSSRFARQADDIEQSVGGISSDTQRLIHDALPSGVEGVDGLLQEVETVTKKISSDYEHVLALPSNQKTLANISRLALSHTKDLLPSLLEISAELQAALEESVNRYNNAMKGALDRMRIISSLESRLADVQTQVVNLDVQSDAFEIIYSVFHMPMIYGSILIESIRRREWSEKMKNDSLMLAEEMAVFRDEEQRRRKKWMKNMGDYLSLPDGAVPGIEVNLQGQEYEWPEVNRKEVELYIEELKSKPGLATIAQELSQMYKDLDAPTRQQRRRAKAFKQGSLIDMGRSSFLLRGDGMVQSLKDEKTKLDDRLKGSESRVRKLEDLLHRQSHMSRPASGHFGLEFPNSPVSAHPDQLSRRSSVSSRRMSANQNPEEKALGQRIVILETELAAERDSLQRLHKEAHVERQNNTDKMQEEQSTKKDLIGNLESRQREFEDERRYLEGEGKRYKIRVEELEEELDRVMDSREHERQDADERIQQLELELQDAHANAEEEAQKMNNLGQAESEKEGLRNQVSELERRDLERQDRDQEDLNALQAALMHLSPGGVLPSDVPGIIKAIEVLSEGLSIHAKRAEENASKATDECKELEERLSQMESEAEELRKTSGTREEELSRVREDLSQEKAKLSILTSELSDESSKLSALQSQFAAGETGSDALRQQVADEELKGSELSQRLAEVETKARKSEVELSSWKSKADAMAEAEKKAASRNARRGSRSQELSRQLLGLVERFGRMLEQLGFVVVRHNGNIVVQRASKVNASSTSGDNLSQSNIVSMKPDPEVMNWMEAESSEEETDKFMIFMESLYQFDVDMFGDAVVKRVKDIELLARKWQKEARGYREKYHRFQGDAHDKIAYRSFKEGDLALFLPTRNQAIRSWAAFNVGAPHYFLREQDTHKLQTRDWLLARITKIEERVVDLSKSMNGANPDRRSIGAVSDSTSLDDENPFELSDGLRWYLVDATEEKPGAPATPGLGKSTVASANVDARGSIRLGRPSTGGNVAKTLTKSLDSRRNSNNSKKGPPQLANDSTTDLTRQAENEPGSRQQEEGPVSDEVRRDQLQDP